MAGIKHIDRYILKNFFRTFTSTFFASLFVLLMQFIFRHIDDFIGKGVGFCVLAEFFWHASLSLVPLSLPLSILIGSLMTFGNLGERFELLAMKAAGISLFRIMRPLIIVMVFIAIGSFYFSDHVLPYTQVRMWTLIFSIREKPLELEIPEGSFYNGITGRNIYVGQKSSDALLDVVIYDYSNGFENTSIILADTGYISQTEDRKKLILRLHSGETFEHLKQSGDAARGDKIMPYRRENFSRKEIVIDYDGNFNELDPEFLERQYVSKNTKELQYAVDSIRDYISGYLSKAEEKVQKTTYFNRNQKTTEQSIDTTGIAPQQTYANIDDLYLHLNDYNKKITAVFYNSKKSSVSLKKCPIVKFIIKQNGLIVPESQYGQFWINGISNVSAITDTIQFLGFPSHFYRISENKYYLDWFISEEDRRSGITVYVDTAEDHVDSIEFAYY